MIIKLVAFDWNGTILSDTNAAIKAETEVLKHFGYPPTNLKQFQATFTIPIRNYWIAMGIPAEIFDRHSAEIQSMFMSKYEPLESLSRTRSGSGKVLKWIKSNDIKAVIFSNHPAPHIVKQLKRLKLSEYIDSVLAREASDNSHLLARIKEIKLTEYINAHGYKPAEVVCVGDTDEETDIAKKHGYRSVALSGGYQSVARLKLAKPDFLIHNLKELKDIIQKL